MQPSPGNSFFKFLAGFFVFISLSFGITYAVQTYTVAQEKAQTAAAIRAIWLGDGRYGSKN